MYSFASILERILFADSQILDASCCLFIAYLLLHGDKFATEYYYTKISRKSQRMQSCAQHIYLLRKNFFMTLITIVIIIVGTPMLSAISPAGVK